MAAIGGNLWPRSAPRRFPRHFRFRTSNSDFGQAFQIPDKHFRFQTSVSDSGQATDSARRLACWRYGTREAVEMLAVCVAKVFTATDSARRRFPGKRRAHVGQASGGPFRAVLCSVEAAGLCATAGPCPSPSPAARLPIQGPPPLARSDSEGPGGEVLAGPAVVSKSSANSLPSKPQALLQLLEFRVFFRARGRRAGFCGPARPDLLGQPGPGDAQGDSETPTRKLLRRLSAAPGAVQAPAPSTLSRRATRRKPVRPVRPVVGNRHFKQFQDYDAGNETALPSQVSGIDWHARRAFQAATVRAGSRSSPGSPRVRRCCPAFPACPACLTPK